MEKGRKSKYCRNMQSAGLAGSAGATGYATDERTGGRSSCAQGLDVLPHISMCHPHATGTRTCPLKWIITGQIRSHTQFSGQELRPINLPQIIQRDSLGVRGRLKTKAQPGKHPGKTSFLGFYGVFCFQRIFQLLEYHTYLKFCDL